MRKVFPSITAMAREIGVARYTLDRVIRGKDTSARVAAAVAAVLQMQPHEIWPGLYAADGQPLRRRIGRAA